MDRPRQRRTGKLYLGPLTWASADHTIGIDGQRIGNTFRTDVLASAESLQDNVEGEGYLWCVWSRSNGAVSAIERVEMDNSYDVIRKRKAAPTARDARTFAPQPDLALGA